MKRLNDRSTKPPSHGVAAGNSPRREPWGTAIQTGRAAEQRKNFEDDAFFRPCRGLICFKLPTHGSRRGLLAAAAPQLLLALLAIFSFSIHAAALPDGWRREQSFTLSASGLTKVSLPVETLDAARPALEDLRVFDDAGNEVPYILERPVPTVKIVRTVKSFQVAMQARATIISIETGLMQPLDTVTLETPALDFLKPVRVEASADGKTWQTLAQGLPVFRLPNGASRLQLNFSSGVWAWLRLTVDDQRSAPVPFTGARVQATVTESAPVETAEAMISERHENPGATRLALNLGAANLSVASMQIATDEPLFARQVTLAVPQVSEDAIREQPVGKGAIYRVAVEGQAASENLSVPLEQQVRSRELLVLIKNEDSPPLPVTAVRIERRPVYLVFLAKQSGAFHLLTGNEHCPAPKYDLAALGMNLKSVAVSPVKISPPTDSASYRTPEVLPGVEDAGAALDVADWKYRQPVKLTHSGAQQLELDLDVLSQAQPGLGDLRLLRSGKQVPYLLEHTSITRAIQPGVTAIIDAKDPKLSRWILKLPQPNLPVTRLTCVARTALFEREMTVQEEVADQRGEKYRRTVGNASWVQTPNRTNREFSITLNGPLQSDTLFLETRNGDNPPIALENFQLFHPVSRVVFKAAAADEFFLYYGNPRVASPRYDLSLVAGQLLTAEKSIATLAAREQLKKSAWGENRMPGQGGLLFWGILAVVVVGLLVVISRLLPKSSPPA